MLSAALDQETDIEMFKEEGTMKYRKKPVVIEEKKKQVPIGNDGGIRAVPHGHDIRRLSKVEGQADGKEAGLCIPWGLHKYGIMKLMNNKNKHLRGNAMKSHKTMRKIHIPTAESTFKETEPQIIIKKALISP